MSPTFTWVLVPLDGSQRAERLLPVAVRIARATHLSILKEQLPYQAQRQAGKGTGVTTDTATSSRRIVEMRSRHA